MPTRHHAASRSASFRRRQRVFSSHLPEAKLCGKPPETASGKPETRNPASRSSASERLSFFSLSLVEESRERATGGRGFQRSPTTTVTKAAALFERPDKVLRTIPATTGTTASSSQRAPVGSGGHSVSDWSEVGFLFSIIAPMQPISTHTHPHCCDSRNFGDGICKGVGPSPCHAYIGGIEGPRPSLCPTAWQRCRAVMQAL